MGQEAEAELDPVSLANDERRTTFFSIRFQHFRTLIRLFSFIYSNFSLIIREERAMRCVLLLRQHADFESVFLLVRAKFHRIVAAVRGRRHAPRERSRL